MRKFLALGLFIGTFALQAQSNAELLKHYQAYYSQMKIQGDVQGIINSLTHLNILSPSQARKDTLAYIYTTEGKYMQALNTLGVEKSASDSDISLEVKAISLKALKQPEMAIGFFEEIFKRRPSAPVAYELTELNIQTQKYVEADTYIAYGLANATKDQKRAFYEKQTPYEVPLKSAFQYMEAISLFSKDKAGNIDAAVDILDNALKEAPNFNLIQITKSELLRQKQVLQSQATQPQN